MRVVTRPRDERGIAIISAMMAVVVVFAVGALWVAISQHQVVSSTSERVRVQATSAAEAGLNEAMSWLSYDPTYAGRDANNQGPSSGANYGVLNDSAGNAIGRYLYTICQPSSTVTGCPTFTDTNERYLISRGFAPTSSSVIGSARRLEEQINLVATDGFRYALFASPNGVSLANNATITGDVYSNTDLTITNTPAVNGSIISEGAVNTGTNNVLVGGDIRAIGNVTVGHGTTVNGNVYAGTCCPSPNTSSASISGLVKGFVQAAGTITGSGTVNGAKNASSPPVPPVQRQQPVFSWAPSNYASIKNFTTQTSFDGASGVWKYCGGSCKSSDPSDAGAYYCASGCGSVTIGSAWQLSDDVTIVTNGPVTWDTNAKVTNNAGKTVTVTIVSTYASSCPSGTPAISMNNQQTVGSNIKVLLYAPNGPVQFNNLKDFQGAVYGSCIGVNNNMTLTYFPVTPPGFNWDSASSTHFAVQAVNFKEVPYS